MFDQRTYSVGVVGARGYAGAEVISLIQQHPNLILSYAASRSQIDEPIPGIDGCTFTDADPDSIGKADADAVILAVPDGASRNYTHLLRDRIVVDLSSDHRFDDEWVYGLSELNTKNIIGATRISNPGCYATALQLAASPLLSILEGPIHAFGVSGYSGAGTTPSDRNNPAMLDGGITPYALTDHTHEREATRHLSHSVRFTPHVAPYFRGITLTLQAHTNQSIDLETIIEIYQQTYLGADLIELLGPDVPRVQEIDGQSVARIGGVSIGTDQRSFAVVCVIDNLLKGAASQAIQNLNLAFGLPMNTGLLKETCI